MKRCGYPFLGGGDHSVASHDYYARLSKLACCKFRARKKCFLIFLLAQWERDHDSCLPTKVLKGPGQATFESYMSQGQVGINFFFQALGKEKQDRDHCTYLSTWQADRLENIKHSSFIFFTGTHVFKNTDDLK